MSSRIFQNVIIQMKDAVDRPIGVVDEQGFVVAASELWRTTSLYARWYKALSAQGNGVWVGTGFYDQSVLRFTQVSSEQRKRIAVSDGFVAIRGNATAVRLVAEARPSEISPP